MVAFDMPIPGESVGAYDIVRQIGEGASSVVFLALSPAGEDVAIKILRPARAEEPEILKAFRDEAIATHQVEQKNVVQIIAHGQGDGYHYTVMEFVDGPSLQELLDERGALPWREAAKTVIQIARALLGAHEQGYVHRDVKPHNILLYQDGRARLTDFGIVKDIGSLKGYLLAGKPVGTARYASPEQCLGKRVSPATDVYSLGATYYHMVCGRPPFKGKSKTDVMAKHVNEKPVSPAELVSELPKGLSNLIDKMLSKKQADRPEIPRVIRDLVALVKGQVPIGPSVSSRRRR